MSNPQLPPRIFLPDDPELGQGERVFTGQFTPDTIRFRGEEIETLTKFFNPQSTHSHQGALPVAVLLGPVGSGKLLVTKAIAQNFTSFLPRIGESLPQPITANCRSDLKNIMITFLYQIIPGFSSRGMSLPTLVNLFREQLQSGLFLLIILTEVERLSVLERTQLISILLDEDILYQTGSFKINLLLVTKDLEIADELCDSILSQQLITGLEQRSTLVTLERYAPDQNVVILNDRAIAGLESSVFNASTIEEIVTVTAPLLDTRLAIDFLWRTATVAQTDNASQLADSHIDRAFQSLGERPFDVLNTFTQPHRQLYLYSLLIELLGRETDQIRTSELDRAYFTQCAARGIKPREKTTRFDYLREYESLGLILKEKVGPYPNSPVLIKVPSRLQIPIRDHLRELMKDWDDMDE